MPVPKGTSAASIFIGRVRLSTRGSWPRRDSAVIGPRWPLLTS